ncbi:MAG TPA: biopolymer transporter ExbD [Gemmatimonadaceae bacterium]|nr:biopolymer transporter ExbD [Gemmatimonadaceae bacterium]
MPSRFHRARQRRAERVASESSERLNLVPLVDILTSIVFYALLTAATAGASLLAFDIGSPRGAARNDSSGGEPEHPSSPPITLTVHNDRTAISRGGERAGILLSQPAGLDRAALDRLEGALAGLHRGADAVPAGTPAVVVPGDDVSYERVVGVLERLRRAEFREMSLGMVARTTPASCELRAATCLLGTPGASRGRQVAGRSSQSLS